MKKTLRIDGMSCGHCVAAVEKALRAVPGVADAKADLSARSAVVVISGVVPDTVLREAVADVGFAVLGVE